MTVAGRFTIQRWSSPATAAAIAAGDWLALRASGARVEREEDDEAARRRSAIFGFAGCCSDKRMMCWVGCDG